MAMVSRDLRYHSAYMCVLEDGDVHGDQRSILVLFPEELSIGTRCLTRT